MIIAVPCLEAQDLPLPGPTDGPPQCDLRLLLHGLLYSLPVNGSYMWKAEDKH